MCSHALRRIQPDERQKLQNNKKKKEEQVDDPSWKQNLVEKRIISKQLLFNYYSSEDYTALIFACVKTGIFSYTIKGPNGDEIAYISSNFLSNKFKVYTKEKLTIMNVTFCLNFLGMYGPLKFYVELLDIENKFSKNFIFGESFRTIYEFENKEPRYCRSLNCYLLKFKGRKIKSSVKNFQLIMKKANNTHPQPNNNTITEEANNNTNSCASTDLGNSFNNNPNDIFFQFAKDNDNYFFADFKPPFNHLNAFALAIIVLSKKTFCEQKE